jgi:hypothetical protein
MKKTHVVLWQKLIALIETALPTRQAWQTAVSISGDAAVYSLRATTAAG